MAVIAVVGGGIGGLVAAHTLKKLRPEHRVVIIESSHTLGGLLSISHQTDSYCFDIGTHIPAETQIKELDQWLYGAIYEDDSWSKIPKIKGANYFRGRLDESHHNIASHTDYDQLSDGVPASKVPNLLDDYLFRFGHKLTSEIFVPSLTKFVPFALDEIEPEVKRYFALDRLSVHAGRHPHNDAASTPLIKTRIDLTGKIIPLAFYPNNGEGVFRWIKMLTAQLNAEGVEFLTGKKLIDLVQKDSLISAMRFSDQSELECDYLVWTAPIETLGQLADKSLYDRWAGLYQRTTIRVFHFVFDRKFLTSCHYVNCFEPELAPYRITLYDNFGGHSAVGYKCTVEIIGATAASDDCTADRIIAELKQMALVDQSSEVLYQYESTIHNGFPIRKIGATQAAEQLRDDLLSSYPNLTLAGSAKPGVFFSNDVMIKTFTELKSAVEAGSFQ